MPGDLMSWLGKPKGSQETPKKVEVGQPFILLFHHYGGVPVIKKSPIFICVLTMNFK